MADETTEQPAIPAEGGEAAPAAGAEAAPPKKGIKALLVPVLAVLLAAGAGVGTIKLKDKLSGGAPAPKTDEHTESTPAAEGGGHATPAPAPGGHGTPAPAAKATPAPSGHGAPAAASSAGGPRNKDLPVPLTTTLITFSAAAKAGDADKILTINAKGDAEDIAVPTAIVRNIAGTSGASYIAVSVSLVSDQDDFITKLNLKNQYLLAAAGETLARLTMKDLDQPGVQTIISRYLKAEFNNLLGSGSVKDVLLVKFAIQR